jgi:hypothetical protein
LSLNKKKNFILLILFKQIIRLNRRIMKTFLSEN